MKKSKKVRDIIGRLGNEIKCNWCGRWKKKDEVYGLKNEIDGSTLFSCLDTLRCLEHKASTSRGNLREQHLFNYFNMLEDKGIPDGKRYLNK